LKIKLYQVDAFTNEIFKGNPAGVCILPGQTNIDNKLLQNIAMEMNLSETAFLIKEKNEYNLRLRGLVQTLKEKRYRAQLVRSVHIPKGFFDTIDHE